MFQKNTRVVANAQHGTRKGYEGQGCRCDECRAWRAEYRTALLGRTCKCGRGPMTRSYSCLACCAERETARRLRDPETYDRRQRSNRLRAFYKRDVDWYEALLAEQGGVCAICKQSCPSGRALAVDHDRGCCSGPRSCGRCVRALLCMHCNNGIGRFHDEPELMEVAIAYIRRYRGE